MKNAKTDAIAAYVFRTGEYPDDINVTDDMSAALRKFDGTDAGEDAVWNAINDAMNDVDLVEAPVAALTETATVTFSNNVDNYVRAAFKASGVAFDDRSVEVGLYSRTAYRCSLADWNEVASVLATFRAGKTGSAKSSLNRAISRIPKTVVEAPVVEAPAPSPSPVMVDRNKRDASRAGVNRETVAEWTNLARRYARIEGRETDAAECAATAIRIHDEWVDVFGVTMHEKVRALLEVMIAAFAVEAPVDEVEALMGYPEGWTEFAHLVTPLSLCKSPKRSDDI